MKKGFTLIEMMVVISILGIVGATTVPQMLRHSGTFTADAAAEQLACHIRFAQEYAISRHTNCTIEFNISRDFYRVSDSEGNVVENAFLKGGIASLKDNVDLYETTFAAPENQVTFSPSGSPTQGGEITVKKGSESYKIGVEEQTGTVSVWRSTN